MARHSMVAMLQIETDDRRLDPDGIDVSTARAASAVRGAVLQAVRAGELSRVIAVLPVETASRPPADYVPPTQE